jgi:ElaB/YqjD/DUF883 family membrane-anchored ribosome-binding protein
MYKEDIKENLRDTKENLNELKEEGFRRAREKYQNLKDTAWEKREKMKNYARTNPEEALLIAAGAGFAVGLIISIILANKRK